jgi:phosphoribulokinase
VLAELDRREDDSVSFIRPQERYADLVVSFTSPDGSDADHLDAQLALRDGLAHPDLSPFIDDGGGSTTPSGRCTSRAGSMPTAPARSSRRSSQRLGEFTVGTELHRSESLALVQLLILCHMVTARAKIALGGEEVRYNDAGPDPGRVVAEVAT